MLFYLTTVFTGQQYLEYTRTHYFFKERMYQGIVVQEIMQFYVLNSVNLLSWKIHQTDLRLNFANEAEL